MGFCIPTIWASAYTTWALAKTASQTLSSALSSPPTSSWPLTIWSCSISTRHFFSPLFIFYFFSIVILTVLYCTIIYFILVPSLHHTVDILPSNMVLLVDEVAYDHSAHRHIHQRDLIHIHHQGLYRHIVRNLRRHAVVAYLFSPVDRQWFLFCQRYS